MDSKFILEDFSHGKEYIRLMEMYDDYRSQYDIYKKAIEETDVELFNKKHYDLLLMLCNIVDHIDKNRDNLHQFKQDTFFKQVEDLLYVSKNNLPSNDLILKFRKCLIWIRKKW